MTGWFFANLAWASLLMLVVLAVRRPFAALFGAGPTYALWLLPALRLVMPPLPSFAAELTPALPPLTLIVSAAGEAAPLPPDGGLGQWMAMMLAIWAGGAALFLLWQYLTYRRFLTEMRLSARGLGAHRGLPLIESAAVEGPLALGLLDRRIVVPADFATRYTAEEQRLALDHESVHHRRGDIWWNHVGLIMLALNWFNPVAWFAFRAFRADQELACDAAVAATASPQARHDYARALIKSASRPGLIAACPLNHADQLKRRLKMMKTHKQSRLRMLSGAAAVAILAGAGLALGSPGLAQPAEQEQAETRIERDAATGRDENRETRVIVMTRPAEGDAGHRAGGAHHPGPGHQAGGDDRHVVRTIVRSHHREAGEDHADHRGMAGHHAATTAHCREGNRPIVNSNETNDNRTTRFILCGPNSMDPARQLQALERARAELADDAELSREARNRVLATLDREIARLRAN